MQNKKSEKFCTGSAIFFTFCSVIFFTVFTEKYGGFHIRKFYSTADVW